MDPQIHVYADVPWADVISQAPIVPLVSIVLAFVFTVLLAVGLLILAFVSAVRGGGKAQKLRRFEADETRVFQDLQSGFKRMNERVDSLETLFIGHSQAKLYDQEC